MVTLLDGGVNGKLAILIKVLIIMSREWQHIMSPGYVMFSGRHPYSAYIKSYDWGISHWSEIVHGLITLVSLFQGSLTFIDRSEQQLNPNKESHFRQLELQCTKNLNSLLMHDKSNWLKYLQFIIGTAWAMYEDVIKILCPTLFPHFYAQSTSMISFIETHCHLG